MTYLSLTYLSPYIEVMIAIGKIFIILGLVLLAYIISFPISQKECPTPFTLYPCLTVDKYAPSCAIGSSEQNWWSSPDTIVVSMSWLTWWWRDRIEPLPVTFMVIVMNYRQLLGTMDVGGRFMSTKRIKGRRELGLIDNQ